MSCPPIHKLTGNSNLALDLARSEEVDRVIAGARILIVDDDELSLYCLKRLFINCKDLRVANSGNSGIAEIQKKGDKPDIILSDYQMCDGTGEDLYRALIKQSRALAERVIIITGHDRDYDNFTEERATKGRLVEKPYNNDELRAIVARVLIENMAESSFRHLPNMN